MNMIFNSPTHTSNTEGRSTRKANKRKPYNNPKRKRLPAQKIPTVMSSSY